MAHFVGSLGPVEVYHHGHTLPHSNLQRKYEGKYYNTHGRHSKQHWLPVDMTKERLQACGRGSMDAQRSTFGHPRHTRAQGRA